jgi:quercetin dioxygenase-like cupin family protein
MSVLEDAAVPGAPAIRVGHDVWRYRAPKVPGSQVAIIVDEAVPGADQYIIVNVLAPGGVIPLHWHSISEFQFILSGTGVFVAPDGQEQRLGPHDTVFCPGGRAGAHGFRNEGPLPLAIQCVYPSHGGQPPDMVFLNMEADKA